MDILFIRNNYKLWLLKRPLFRYCYELYKCVTNYREVHCLEVKIFDVVKFGKFMIVHDFYSITAAN